MHQIPNVSCNEAVDLIQKFADFPHIEKKLRLFWGTSDMMPEYLNTLIVNTRSSNRNGFPFEQFQALSKIYELHSPDGIPLQWF